MPIIITHQGDGGVVLTGENIVTGNDLIRSNDEIYKTDQLIKEISYQLCDFTEVKEFDVSTQELREVALQDKMASEINPNMIIAVVGERD